MHCGIDPSPWQDEFPLASELAYLNHAGVAPWPRRARDAVGAFADENLTQGARNYPAWAGCERRLRAQMASLINVSAEDIALLKSTSEGLSFVAGGLRWHPGDNVVSSDQEFPSNRYVWEALGRQGVGLRCVPLDPAARPPEQALMAACDTRTRVLAISAVQYASGLRMDLARLGEFCRSRGIVFCVDAIQWLGADALDAQAIQADFVIADGHKWMLGPEGVALFYVHPRLRDRLQLLELGWNSVEAAGEYERCLWSPAASARRFECGSPNMVGIHGLSASLSLLQEVGLEQVHQAIAERVDWLIEALDATAGARLLSPRSRQRRCGIVTFALDGVDPRHLHAALRDQGVVGAMRGGGIRWSPHFYTSAAALEHAISALHSAGAQAARRLSAN